MKTLQEFYLKRFNYIVPKTYTQKNLSHLETKLLDAVAIIRHTVTLLQATDYKGTEEYRQLAIELNVIANRTLGLTDRKVSCRLFCKLFRKLRADFYQIAFVKYPLQVASKSENDLVLGQAEHHLNLKIQHSEFGNIYNIYHQTFKEDNIIYTSTSITCDLINNCARFGGLLHI